MFCERIHLPATNNQMVRDTDINELKRLHQTLRYSLICTAGSSAAGGAAMRQYHSWCIEIQVAFVHLTGLYRGSATGVYPPCRRDSS